MLLQSGRHRKNWWLRGRTPIIPLGTMTEENHAPVLLESGKHQFVTMRYPSIDGVPVSRSILIVGQTRSGKSTQEKLVLYFQAQNRPILGEDPAGQDLYLMHERNTLPENLPPNTIPDRLFGSYLFVPTKDARNMGCVACGIPSIPVGGSCWKCGGFKSWERVYRPNITKYSMVHLVALGFSEGGAKLFRNALDKYGPFNSWESLLQFFTLFPTKDTESTKIIKDVTDGRVRFLHKKLYEPNDTIHQASKGSILKILPVIIEKGIFRLDNKQEFDFTQTFFRGEHMIFSYNDVQVARIEIAYHMEQSVAIRRQYPTSPRYFIALEEAQDILADEGKLIDKVITSFILKCGKTSLGFSITMATADERYLPQSILNDIKEIICGQLRSSDAQRIATACGNKYVHGQPMKEVLQNLEFKHYGNEREFFYFSGEHRLGWTYRPFNSPVQIHREVTA